MNNKKSKIQIFIKTSKGFLKNIPMMIGVILLISLIKTFVSFETISTLFIGKPLVDTALGAIFGSILAGNSINSYIIGKEMLASGISLLAVTSFLVAWVTVGFVQIPVESKILGGRFTLIRNSLSVILSICISMTTIWIIGGIS
ncbi:MAG TPA: permease [Clostridia bacterium]|nr:permease [Clostridia bacterium]